MLAIGNAHVGEVAARNWRQADPCKVHLSAHPPKGARPEEREESTSPSLDKLGSPYEHPSCAATASLPKVSPQVRLVICPRLLEQAQRRIGLVPKRPRWATGLHLPWSRPRELPLPATAAVAEPVLALVVSFPTHVCSSQAASEPAGRAAARGSAAPAQARP
ncbi:hypothetical protein BKA66DRAFT_607593 [Pyrenochaeta sp. MPI-SDFR-AT-0127]|nr:hypothetical protein BKA66DRAFT_607593 [Pyrenochaeta sp. MPI-SDFR-AT-0127]